MAARLKVRSEPRGGQTAHGLIPSFTQIQQTSAFRPACSKLIDRLGFFSFDLLTPVNHNAGANPQDMPPREPVVEKE